MSERDDRHLSIGQFAEAARLSQKALRLYHQLGILSPTYVDPESGYRYYLAKQLQSARLIRMMRQMDMPLATIREVMANQEADPAQAQAMVERYVQEFETRVAEVRQTAALLKSALSGKEIEMTFEVEVKEVPVRQIASLTGRIKVGQLDRFIRRSLTTLSEVVEGQGGQLQGEPFGIYHGPINQEEDGPIEVCWAVTGPVTGDDEIVVRELPGGLLAVAAARGAECQFPAILGAYDAACEWIVANGYEITDSPQEVWYSGPGEDARMEICWPFR